MCPSLFININETIHCLFKLYKTSINCSVQTLTFLMNSQVNQSVSKNISALAYLTKNLPVLPICQWLNMAQFYKKNIVFYQDSVIDISNLMAYHPGGSELLLSYRNKDITNIFFKIYPHSKQALSILRRYQIGKLRKNQKDACFIQPSPQRLKTISFNKRHQYRSDICSKQSFKLKNFRTKANIHSTKKVTFSSDRQYFGSQNDSKIDEKFKKPRVSIQLCQQQIQKALSDRQLSEDKIRIDSSSRILDLQGKKQFKIPVFQAKFMNQLNA